MASLTWGEVAGLAYGEGVVTVKQVLFERRVLWFRVTVVLALVAGEVDGRICGFASEASQPVDSPAVVAFGPEAGRQKLLRRLGL